MRSFKGIPYAEPPIGDKRWTAPVAAGPWKGVRDARDFGASCFETSYSPQSLFNVHPPKLSEDCLFLNVWTPPHAKKAPVIVWIHGGGFVRGGSWEPQYEGTHFAEHGVVFVIDQLPARCARLAGVAGAERGIAARRLRQLRSARSNRSAQMGEEEHRRVRRRSRQRDHHG